MPRYMVGGCEEDPVLHLLPGSGDHGVELPAELHRRWRRAELDAVEPDMVVPAMTTGQSPGRFTIDVITPGGGGHANHDYRADAEPNGRGQRPNEYAGVRSC